MLTDLALGARGARGRATVLAQARRPRALIYSTTHRRAAVAAPRRDPLRRAGRRQPPGTPRPVAAPARAPPARGRAAAAAVERRRRWREAGAPGPATERARSCAACRSSPRRAVAERARDIAAITYAAQPAQEGPRPRARGLARVRVPAARPAMATELVVAGASGGRARERRDRARGGERGVRVVGLLARGRVPRAAAPRAACSCARRGARTTGSRSSRRSPTAACSSALPRPGPYAALAIARELDPRLVGEDLAGALRLRARASRDAAYAAARARRARALQPRRPSTRWSPSSCFRACLPERARSSLRSGPRVGDVGSRVSQARRAVAMPQRMFCSVADAVRVGVDHDPSRPRAPRRARGRRRGRGGRGWR